MIALHLLALVAAAQDLGDVARKESERRRQIEAGTVMERKIVQEDLERVRRAGNVATFSVPGTPPSAPAPPPTAGAKSAERYRAALQRLDRQISSVQDRIEALRARMDAERRDLRRSGRAGMRDGPERGARRMELAIREQEVRLQRLRQERLETYDAGRKAGFMPGELDGKGIVP